MKKLGIIGGAGPLASALFYESLVRECYYYGIEIPEIILLNYPFTRALTLDEKEKNRVQIYEELQNAIEQLKRYEVDLACLACNTLHSYLQALFPIDIPFLQLPELVIKETLQNGHQRLLILGTQNTCGNGLYDHPEIISIYPNQEEQRLIDRTIDHVLEGKLLEEDSYLLSQITAHISKRVVVEGVILGCTDLPVLHHHYPIRCRAYLYDSIKLPVKHILRGLL